VHFCMAILCVIIFAAVQHFSLKAIKNFPIQRFDVTTGFSVSVCCEVTIAKRTEWDGEMMGNLVLILNTRNFDKQ